MLYSIVSRLLLALLLIGAVTDARATYVTMTSSEYGNVVAPATVTIGVNGYNDDDGIPIQQVNLFHNGQLIASNPYGLSHTFTGLQVGTHHFTGQAVADGAGASETITIQVIAPGGNPPTVTINAPTGGPFIAPATMTWTANASDPDGQVVRVEYYSNGSHIGTATSAPYAITVNNVAVGTYSVYARAVDNNGGATSSAPTSVTVTPTEVIGYIDSVGIANGEYRALGWACSTGRNQSIDVHMYVGGAYGTGTFVAAQTANQSSEPAVAAACHAQGTAYRFSISLTSAVRQAHANKKIYIHGLSPEGGSNPLLNGSGVYSVPAPLALARRYVYDQHQRLCKVIEPETGSTVMEYDGAGNLAWSASGLNLPDTTSCNRAEAQSSGRVTGRAYDVRNRLTALNFPDGRGNQSWQYTPDGLPSEVITSNGGAGQGNVINTYAYNKRRHLVSETQAQPNWYSWVSGYGYDANGNLRWHSYPTGTVLDYAPNALGQPTQVSSSQHIYASAVKYHPNGAIAQFSYGNGIVHSMTQNSRQLPARSLDNGVLDLRTGYDANGNVIEILDGVRGDQFGRWMAYDSLDRLTAAGSCSFGGDCWHRFSYDALDNLRSWSLGGVKNHHYYYDGRNQLTNIRDGNGASVIGLGYDPQGNLENKNGQVYSFDYGNRLRQIADKESYRYDSLGRRVQSTRQGGGYGLFMYGKSGQMLYSEDHGTPAKALEHIYLGNSLLATRQIDWANTPAIVLYQHTDALGSPVAVTNTAGAVVERTDWEPYGAAIGKPAYNGVGYTGHVMDGATGLTYMQQRYYDPSLGRFLSSDPMMADANTGESFNRYRYAANNPLRFTDPDGRCEKPTGSHICGNSVAAAAMATTARASASPFKSGAAMETARQAGRLLGTALSAPVAAAAVGAGAMVYSADLGAKEENYSYFFYHGTSKLSALSLLAGAPLQVDIAQSLNQHGAPGFYLATNDQMAETFSSYKRDPTVLRYAIRRSAFHELQSAGARLQPIPQGGLRYTMGQEFYIPPMAFGLFNALRGGGQISVYPHVVP